jgi:hypothetical protein
MSVPLSDVVFAFGMEDIFSVGGVRYLRDSGPNGFHFAFPGGAADPTPQLDGSLSFDGGDYLSLPAGRLAEFYAKMPQPAQAYTWMCVGGSTVLAADTARIFECYNLGGGGVKKGLILGYNTTTAAQRIYSYHFLGDAAWNSANTAVGSPSVFGQRSVLAMTIETTPRCLINQSTNVPAWAGSFGNVAYDTAITPRIGGDPVGGSFLTGRLSYLALIRGAISSPDMAQLSAMLGNGFKPFCQRAS